MQAYESGGHAYHTTMPTDALRAFRDTMLETKEYGFDRLCKAQWDLGNNVRAKLSFLSPTNVLIWIIKQLNLKSISSVNNLVTKRL